VVAIFEEKDGYVSKEELYEKIYGDRNLEGALVFAAYRNLELQIQKLIKDGYIHESSPDKYQKVSPSPKI